MEKIDFISSDGEIIKCYEWQPDGKINGIVQIIHGLEEHALRYNDFALFLNKHGYLVFASDQRLHGQTAGKNLSITSIKDVFPVMVNDQRLISDFLIEKYKKPLIILGHSYGSFETQSYIQNYNKMSGAIICGSAYMKRLDTLLGKIVSWSAVKLTGGEKQAKKIEKLVIGSFNRPFKKENGSWISASKENLKKYESDHLCGKPLCANFYYSMFKNTRKLYTKNGLAKIPNTLPILIASGKDDPVGKMGKSTTKLYKTYIKSGLQAKLKIYQGLRHEILNEDNKIMVYNDFLSFINTCCK